MKFKEIISLLPTERQKEAKDWGRNIKNMILLMTGISIIGIIGIYIILSQGCKP